MCSYESVAECPMVTLSCSGDGWDGCSCSSASLNSRGWSQHAQQSHYAHWHRLLVLCHLCFSSERDRETERESRRERFTSFLPSVLLHIRQGPSREAGCLPSKQWRLSSVFFILLFICLFLSLCSVCPVHLHTYTRRCIQYVYRLCIFTYSIQSHPQTFCVSSYV